MTKKSGTKAENLKNGRQSYEILSNRTGKDYIIKR